MNQCRQCHKPIHWDDANCPHCGIGSPHYCEDSERWPRRHHKQDGPDPFRSPLFRLVFPRYQRIALFMMAVSVILVLSTTAELRDWILRYIFGEDRIVPPFVPGVFVLGLLYSLLHGVWMGPLTSKAQQSMLFFAIVVNLVAGVASAVYTLSRAQGIMLALPIWNLFNCALLGLLFVSTFDLDQLSRGAIVDRRVNRFVIGASYGFILAVFFICYCLNVHWSYTFSICITCATNFGGLVDLLSPPISENC